MTIRRISPALRLQLQTCWSAAPKIRRYMPRKWGGSYRRFRPQRVALRWIRLHFGGRLFDGKPVIKARSIAKSTGPLLDYVSKPIFRNPLVRRGAIEIFGRLSEARAAERSGASHPAKSEAGRHADLPADRCRARAIW